MKKQHEPAYGPKIRQKWYFLVEKVGKSVKEVCGLYAISRKTYYKWYGIDKGSREHVPPQKQPKLKLTKVKIVAIEMKIPSMVNQLLSLLFFKFLIAKIK